MRKIFLGLIAAATVAAPIGAQAASRMEQQREARAERGSAEQGVRTGTLECEVGGSVGFIVGSKRDVACTYRAARGPAQRYVGSIDKIGLDVGVTTRSVMVWQVVAPSGEAARAGLEGRYNGVSAGASAVYGASANVLVGGSSGFNLQPLSIQGQRGVNLAAGVASLNLRPAARG